MKATIPYIKVDIPIWVVFRALGVISDRDILEHICYDMQDAQMLEMLKPCIDDGFVIQDREVRISAAICMAGTHTLTCTDRPRLHRQSWYHHRSQPRTSSPLCPGDSAEGDAAAYIHG